jgi:predicted PurR-regulated permease PerM
MMLYRDLFLGVGLLILYAVTLVLRRLAEPRIIGKGIGLHPLAALVSSYIGLRLFGVWGMILAPIGVAALKSAFEGKLNIDKKEAL